MATGPGVDGVDKLDGVEGRGDTEPARSVIEQSQIISKKGSLYLENGWGWMR